jgi:uncharacterized protein YyaL (SSP411 family)
MANDSHKANDLQHESSPYLLQHAYNPVDWKPFNPEVLDKARKERKLLFISIGYSACHWCHVMESECFEDQEVADFLKQHFISIKVDREERPDVDQIYMDAIQLMTGSGGWPLNVICLPDGRPFWGATYLPKDRFLASLNQLVSIYTEDVERVLEYAASLSRGLKGMTEIVPESSSPETIDHSLAIKAYVEALDPIYGGFKGAPKFMMPNTLEYLLHYESLRSNAEVFEHIKTSLLRMGFGGIFDPIDGGFSRYSVDDRWHIPHFEKMAYDNAQLLGLYAEAYQYFNEPFFKEIAAKTATFIQSHFIDPATGGCFTAYDADSLNTEGILEEGAYYVFTKDELQQQLGSNYELFSLAFNIGDFGYWEKDNYVLIRTLSNSEIASKLEIDEREVSTRLEQAIQRLKEARKSRALPLRDHKILMSNTAMMAIGLSRAYRFALREHLSIKETAIKAVDFVLDRIGEDGSLLRNHTGKSATLEGVLEDYAFAIAALIEGYELCFNENYLAAAVQLKSYVIENFSSEDALFYYTSANSRELIRRSIETEDNVISASNSVMAINFFKLYQLGFGEDLKTRALAMLLQMRDRVNQFPKNHSNWLRLSLLLENPFEVTVVSGKKAFEWSDQLDLTWVANRIIAASDNYSNLDLFKGRFSEEQTSIFACVEGSCSLPITDPTNYKPINALL